MKRTVKAVTISVQALFNASSRAAGLLGRGHQTKAAFIVQMGAHFLPGCRYATTMPCIARVEDTAHLLCMDLKVEPFNLAQA